MSSGVNCLHRRYMLPAQLVDVRGDGMRKASGKWGRTANGTDTHGGAAANTLVPQLSRRKHGAPHKCEEEYGMKSTVDVVVDVAL
uniref:Uncharacterized protein n=1 Tax=Panagrellus redivivus TaxID=6233 RepID=A0A7E4UZ42_PANRE